MLGHAMLMSAGKLSSKKYIDFVLSDNPVAFWKLDEITGTVAADSSLNGLSGTYTGGYTLGATPPANAPGAVLLNGSSGYVYCGAPAALNLTAAWTLEAWLYLTATPSGCGIISDVYAAGGNVLYELGFGTSVFSAASTLAAGYYTGSAWQIVVGPSLTLNTWHHVTVVYNGTTLVLYVDGVQVATATPSQAPRAGNNGLYIGHRHDTTASPYFPGRIASAAIYGTALSAERISAHYNAGK